MTGGSAETVRRFVEAATDPDRTLAEAALRMATVEFPGLEPGPWLDRLDEMGREAAGRLSAHAADGPGRPARLAALVRYLYDEVGFTGDRERYDDPWNSCLNEVIARRTGMPITLAIVFMEVGARAGLHAEGVNFPGHFLVRLPADACEPEAGDLLIDPFHNGAIVSPDDCARLLRSHLGSGAAVAPAMFSTAGKRDMLLRMLHNLKRSYVRLRSFGKAREITDLLLALEPGDMSELRDRGLLSYQLRDFSPALRDLQTYLQLATAPSDDETRKEYEQTWEHVKSLRKRIATFN